MDRRKRIVPAGGLYRSAGTGPPDSGRVGGAPRSCGKITAARKGRDIADDKNRTGKAPAIDYRPPYPFGFGLRPNTRPLRSSAAGIPSR